MTDWTDIWIARIKDTDEISVLALLREEDRKRYTQIVPPKKKRHFAFRKMVLDFVLKNYVDSYVIKHNANGKPYILPEKKEQIYFSSSSSTELCVIAVSEKTIGVDVESRYNLVNLISICEKYLPEFDQSNKYWKNTSVVKKIAMYTWCRMESLVKLNGITLHSILFDREEQEKHQYYSNNSYNLVISDDDFVCVVSQFKNIELRNIFHIEFEEIHHE